MDLMVLAPHQDDEVLGAGGLIQICKSRGDSVRVVFATNGDHQGRGVARRRYDESRNALARLGVPESNIYYFGYADTGMRPSHSFLLRLLQSPMDKPLTSPVSSTTYHPADGRTVRNLRTGWEGPLTKETFLLDLAWCIAECSPNLLLMPSRWDAHGDHAALAALAEAAGACATVPTCLSFLVHGGDDLHWPSRASEPCECPPLLPVEVWTSRVAVPLSMEQQRLKRQLIGTFLSQCPQELNGFLYAFARKEEIFFPVRSSTHEIDISIL